MSSSKTSENILENISADLASLAKALAKGKLPIGGRLVSIAEPNFFKTKQKITGNKAYFTLSFQAPLISGNHEFSSEEEQESFPKTPSPILTKTDPEPGDSKRRGRPPEAKKIKKKITGSWKNIFRDIESDRTPAQEDSKKIISACEEYKLFAEKSWQDDWLLCVETLRDSLSAAENGDFDAARKLAAEVNLLTKSCHKKYK